MLGLHALSGRRGAAARTVGFALLLAAAWPAPRAAAQTPFRLDLQHLHPSALPDSGLALAGGPGLPAWTVSVAASFHLGANLQRFDDRSTGLVTTLAALQAPLEPAIALGLPFGFALQFSWPFVVFAEDTAGSRDYLDRTLGYGEPLRGAGLGDPRLELSWRAALTEDVRLLAAFLTTVPVLGGADTGPWAELGSEDAATLGGLVGLDGRLFSLLVLRANVGVRGRTGAGSIGSFRVGSELTYGVGAEVHPIPELHVLAELHGSLAFDDFAGRNTSPLEVVLGARVHPHSDVELLPFVGIGLTQGYGTPEWRVGLTLRAYPHLHDADSDGVGDDADRCPDADEDQDGFEDEDGCPDVDDDGDGFPDANDRCPRAAGLALHGGCPDPDGDHDGASEADRCPDVAEDQDGFEDEDGCPEQDNDGDGFEDGADRCPDAAEDRDGFEDGDGCPERDNDRDGLADGEDTCPREAEDRDGFEDEDGCAEADNDGDGIADGEDGPPDPGGAFGVCRNLPETAGGRDEADPDGCPDSAVTIDVAARRIRVPPVFFDTNADVIQDRSFEDLDYVAELMVANAWIRLLVVEGHTDDRGSAEHNLDLSRRRAASVVRFLTEHGVEASRLRPEGYGRERPPTVTDEPGCRVRTSAECRAAARRVVFVISEIAADDEGEPPIAP